jgi:hypothetical protein
VKETPDGEEKAVRLLKVDVRPPAPVPDTVAPPGLDNKRKWYLFTKIREFCTEATRDIVCPRPPGPEVVEPISDEELEERQPPAKRQQKAPKKTAKK